MLSLVPSCVASEVKESDEVEEGELGTSNPTCRAVTNGGCGGLVAYLLGDTTPEAGGDSEPEVGAGERERDLVLFGFVKISLLFFSMAGTSGIPAPFEEAAASGAESSISNFSSSSDSSSSSSPSGALSVGTSGVVSTDLRLLVRTRGGASSSTTTNDFCRSRSFHLSVREIERNQSVDCWSAQTVGKGYLEAVTLM